MNANGPAVDGDGAVAGAGAGTGASVKCSWKRIEKQRLHPVCGSLVTLSSDHKTAERNEAQHEFNYGIVFSDRQLEENELFEVEIEAKNDIWSGSIEVGLTTCPHLEEMVTCSSATYIRHQDNWVVSGSSILHNGAAFGDNFPIDLDSLSAGDRIGVYRCSSGHLHVVVNRVDFGVVARDIPYSVRALFDVYGKCTRIAVSDFLADERRRKGLPVASVNEAVEPIKFHSRSGGSIRLSNKRRTARRELSQNEMNDGYVFTDRPLLEDELFQVRIDQLINKWSGSIEIGITQQQPQLFRSPLSCSPPVGMGMGSAAIESLTTVMFSGRAIIENGKQVREQYANINNLDDLQAGDALGLIINSHRELRFFVKGHDLGTAAYTLPSPPYYGLLFLYGMDVQLSIQLSICPSSPPPLAPLLGFPHPSSSSPENDRETESELKFHSHCAPNACLLNDSKTAVRFNANGEFNEAIVISSRALLDDELFQVVIEKMVDRWSGSIEVGLTLASPGFISEYPSTMTDLDDRQHSTWMLSGSAVMFNGRTITNSYPVDLDNLPISSKIGVIRKANGDVHFYVNGHDMGVAATDVPAGVYAVIDLYGQCAQVSISNITTSGSTSASASVSASVSASPGLGRNSSLVLHSFKETINLVGLLELKSNNSTVNSTVRRLSDPSRDCLIFTSDSIQEEEVFSIKITSLDLRYQGNLIIGFADESRDALIKTSSSSFQSLNRLMINYVVSLKYNNQSQALIRVNDTEWVPIGSFKAQHTEGSDPFAFVAFNGAVDEICITSQRKSGIRGRERTRETSCEKREYIEGDGGKEPVADAPHSPLVNKPPTLAWDKVCEKYSAHIALPDAFFTERTCCCSDKQGSGWCKFVLKPQLMREILEEKWAYMSVNPLAVRAVLDTRRFIEDGVELLSEYSKAAQVSSREKSIELFGNLCDMQAIDGECDLFLYKNSSYRVRLALQVRMKRPLSTAGALPCPKEVNAIQVGAVLIKFESLGSLGN